MKRQEDELGKPTARSAELVTESFDDGRVVYDERTHAAHSLRSDVAAVWDLCDGRRTPEEIASSLRLDPELVQCALYELEVCDLLEPEELPAVSGIGGLRLDRRAMLKRTAAIGGGVALISSVFVPPAFAFGSNNITFTVTGIVGNTQTGTSTGTNDTGSPKSASIGYPPSAAYYLYCDSHGTVTAAATASPPSGKYVEFDYGYNYVIAAYNYTAAAVTVTVKQAGNNVSGSPFTVSANGGTTGVITLGQGQTLSVTYV